ncbi:MAG: rhomboid family intramembrane serine protease [Sphingomonas sp.]|uniref:rhomboid family intramembrane serine protease n=1 Tax=Sphingomonas sp. TaxID=28214 RepID=UPI0025FE3BA7|nr:rhomboid family intramembrane serine protease [Sphingomonas sp.]MBX3564900.1 rhomboid family intramembrane serine protease [Sphingomonas sp.]
MTSTEELRQEAEDGTGEVIILSWRERLLVEGPNYALAALLAGAWIFALVHDRGMSDWGVSLEALRQGRYETIFAHMFAHGGAMHLVMNISALLPLGATVIWASGDWPGNWLHWAILFLLSGLAGCLAFLLIHADNGVPMLGASGAIFGLWGTVARLGREPGEIVSLWSRQVWHVTRSAVTINLVIFVPLFLLNWALGGNGGLAWESHLGGYAFGLLAAPCFLRARAPR